VTVRTPDGSISDMPYDALVLSPGAEPMVPPIPGSARLRVLRTVEDAGTLADMARGGTRTAVVIGAGFIGLETAENLARRGISTTIVERADQVLTTLDPELAVLVAAELVANGVAVETGVEVSEVTQAGVVLSDGREIPGDLVVAAVGIRPDVRLARMAGIELGPHGGIAVDADGRTSAPDVYAVGDAVEKADSVGGGSSLIALANIANRQGRRVADAICGRDVRPAPSQGTAIVRVFGVAAALTGWNEHRLRAAGRPFHVIHSHPMSHAGYYPGAQPMSMKLLFDPDDGAILGAQVVGTSGVDKRIDVLATAMATGLPAPALADLELAYAPPFSSAKDPVNMLGYMSENVLSGECDVVEPGEVEDLQASGWTLLDVRTEEEHERGAIPGDLNVPLDTLRERLPDLGTGPFVVYCEVGQRGHTATSLLLELGVGARNLDGGYRTWRAADAAAAGDPTRLLRSPVSV
jgi:NADPH-dependent 2,4-dienoyl-CoA reductase/sulfur reductase-like enzyme/rhodanese-related sulfurtransferase